MICVQCNAFCICVLGRLGNEDCVSVRYKSQKEGRGNNLNELFSHITSPLTCGQLIWCVDRSIQALFWQPPTEQKQQCEWHDSTSTMAQQASLKQGRNGQCNKELWSPVNEAGRQQSFFITGLQSVHGLIHTLNNSCEQKGEWQERLM